MGQDVIHVLLRRNVAVMSLAAPLIMEDLSGVAQLTVVALSAQVQIIMEEGLEMARPMAVEALAPAQIIMEEMSDLVRDTAAALSAPARLIAAETSDQAEPFLAAQGFPGAQVGQVDLPAPARVMEGGKSALVRDLAEGQLGEAKISPEEGLVMARDTAAVMLVTGQLSTAVVWPRRRWPSSLKSENNQFARHVIELACLFF